MQLLSIENLSLAAEVTVVLLLLSFAWPQNRTSHDEHAEAGESISWEPAKFFYLQNSTFRGLYLNQWRKNVGSSPTKPFHPTAVEGDDNAQPPTPWQDRLTHLLNRQGFDAIFNAWLSVDGQHRGASCVSMITLSSYSDLTSAHGAMVTEQAIQRIGKQLASDLSYDSVIARYLPDRFVVLHFAASAALSQRAMAHFYDRTLDDSFFQTGGKPLQLPCNISIQPIDADSDSRSTLDSLEEGVSEGERSGRAIVLREDGAWIESPVSFESNTKESTQSEQDLHSKSSASDPNVSASSEKPAEEKKRQGRSDAQEPSTESNSQLSDVEDAHPASNDISAVASPDDIAALFAQINTQKSGAGSTVPSPLGDMEKNPPTTAPASVPVIDTAEAATVDDIAALFATVKPNPQPTGSPATPASQATPVASIAEMDKSEVASADDIASLFASVKPTATATKASSPSASPLDPGAKPNQAAKVEVEIDPNEAASADDIAALFATVKPQTKTPDPAVPATTPVPPKAQGLEVASPSVAVDPNEAASADDIAALFATIKPNVATNNGVASSPPPTATNSQQSEATKLVEAIDPNDPASADDIAALFATVKPTAKSTEKAAVAPAPAKAAELSEAERAESATADDIAALFATVKPAAKKAETPSTPSQSTSSSKTVSSPATPSNAVPSGEELSQVATPDDIASLLASIKPTAPVAKQPEKTPSPVSPTNPAIPAGEQLSETASLDDIEALFAAVKPAAPANSFKQTTAAANVGIANKTTAQTPPAAIAPPEDLSSNASLDDIEALFAAMKK